MSEQKPAEDKPTKPLTGQQAYNLVTDTVGGPNVRLKDNFYQGLAIAVCLVLGAGIGFLVGTDSLIGVLVGGFIGLIVGLFGSGVFLMIFRAIRHARGKHD
jgi:NADH:ubiquinone oxidoreductase subunit 6 (subunit J)